MLDAPLNTLIADKSLDFLFYVMWANENWTRNWDRLEREVLIAQEYCEADDEVLIALPICLPTHWQGISRQPMCWR